MVDRVDSKNEIESIPQMFSALCVEDGTPLILSNKSKTVVPSKLNISLYDFQKEGVQFLYESFNKGSGAILNDVPCSGKKVQVIAFISALTSSQKALSSDEHHRSDCYPALIICPRGKIRIWESRIKSWSSLKCSVCSDLNISKATDSTDIVLFPFDLLPKSVVNVAKRKWKVLFVDSIEIITMKYKYEILLHHLPPVHRFGISSKNLDAKESLATVISWVYPTYYQQLKKEKAKIFSCIENFDKKTGKISDQIRGLHLKAHLLSLRNEFFVKRDGDIPEALISLLIDEEEEVIDYLPPTSSVKVASSNTNKSRSNEKISPKAKAQRTNSSTVTPANDDEDEMTVDKQSRTVKPERSTDQKEFSSKKSNLEMDSDRLAELRTSEAHQSDNKHFEPEPSFFKASDATEESRLKDANASENAFVPSENIIDYELIDTLFLSSKKVLKSPQKSRKRVYSSTQLEVETKDSAKTCSEMKESSLIRSPDFESQQMAMLNSLFLKTPPQSKPAPSKFKSFSQASQKTKTGCSWESRDANFSAATSGESKTSVISQDLDSLFLRESLPSKSPPGKAEETKKSCSPAPAELLDNILFSQPASRKAPPKRKYLTHLGTDLDKEKPSRQPMQPIKNLDQDSTHLKDSSCKKNKFSEESFE